MLTFLGENLLDLGIITPEVAKDEAKLHAACNEFCPHHVSHYLGMDVHDTALISRNIPLPENSVITMEPGIYIPRHPPANSKYLSLVPEYFRGLGARIEDDILITKDTLSNQLSCEILSKDCPKSVKDIEELMED